MSFVVLAMGKFGGRELNLSSDIDLIYLYRVDSDPDPFFKLAEKITKSLSAVTQDGFLYRVDLALRPGGGKSTVAVPIEGALEHYFYWGRYVGAGRYDKGPAGSGRFGAGRGVHKGDRALRI